jgi:hypothetical protein
MIWKYKVLYFRIFLSLNIFLKLAGLLSHMTNLKKLEWLEPTTVRSGLKSTTLTTQPRLPLLILVI